MGINSEGKLEITDLDFDTVKSNFKTFLSQQSEFSDYNFEGSGMSVLMDLLAYNTHYLAFHANMLANEMFLDTSLTERVQFLMQGLWGMYHLHQELQMQS